MKKPHASAWLLAGLLLLTAARVEAATFLVTNDSDSGAGSLRQAILDANGNPGPDDISFTELFSFVQLLTALPDLTDDVDIVGNGADHTFIQRAGGVLFRIFNVATGIIVRLEGLTISRGQEFLGGGVQSSGHLIVDACLFRDNRAGAGGAAINTSSEVNGSLLVTNTTFFRNIVAIGNGGAIGYSHPATGQVINSTFSENVAGEVSGGCGGAISVNAILPGVVLQILNCTITGNTSGFQGGGVCSDVGFGGTAIAVLGNTIVAGNVDQIGSTDLASNFGGQFVSLGGNLIGDSTSLEAVFPAGLPNAITDLVGTAGSPLDPGLLPVGLHGGTTFIHPLDLGSPAIDKGQALGGLLPVDQRGQSRTADGDGDGNAVVDIGAVETQRYPVSTLLDDGTNIPGSLREAFSLNGSAGAGHIVFERIGVVTLSEPLIVTRSAVLVGPGADLLTLRRDTANPQSFRLLTATFEVQLRLSGLTLTGGESPDPEGGGAVRTQATLIADNCVFVNNAALVGNGGAIDATGGGSLELRSCLFENNRASFGGGAVRYSTPVALLGPAGIGGNRIEACRFIGNRTIGAPGLGGAFRLSGGMVTVARCLFDSNQATVGGGIAVDNSFGILNVVGSLFEGNMASSSGGALDLDAFGVSTDTLENCTISGNSAPMGGGLRVTDRDITIDHCTITGNTATVEGGGMVADGIGGQGIRNSIVADNSAAVSADLLSIGYLGSGGGNVVGDNSGAFGFTAGLPNGSGDFVGTTAAPVDPGLRPLGENGGLLATHALEFDSVAIDIGVPSPPLTDQRGHARNQDGDGDSVSLPDAGAYEVDGFGLGNVNAAGLTFFFSDDLEGGAGNFTTISPTGNGDWAIVVNPSACSGSRAFFSRDLRNIKDDRLESVSVALPAGDVTLKFSHRYDLEPGFDGGVLEASFDGGPFIDLGTCMTGGGYDTPLSPGFGNPIGGRMAWSGVSSDCESVTVDLSPFAGTSMVLRFRLGCDISVAGVGWFVDDIRIGTNDGNSTTDVLFINGMSGLIALPNGVPFTVELRSPPCGPDPSRYFVYIWTGLGSNPTVFRAGGIDFGVLANPGPLQGGSPQPVRCLRGQGISPNVCQGVSQAPSPPFAPWLINAPGVNQLVSFTFQGLMEDRGSPNPMEMSVTNAVTVEFGAR